MTWIPFRVVRPPLPSLPPPTPSNIGNGDAVIESFFGLIRKVAEAIPLRSHLGIEGPNVIIDRSSYAGDKFLMEYFPAQEG